MATTEQPPTIHYQLVTQPGARPVTVDIGTTLMSTFVPAVGDHVWLSGVSCGYDETPEEVFAGWVEVIHRAIVGASHGSKSWPLLDRFPNFGFDIRLTVVPVVVPR